MITTINEMKKFLKRTINESSTDNVEELYNKFGDQYPYACDLIAYFIFDSKESDNIIKKATDGINGRNTKIDASDVSAYALDYEYGWDDYMETIDSDIRNFPTQDGGKLSDYY